MCTWTRRGRRTHRLAVPAEVHVVARDPLLLLVGNLDLLVLDLDLAVEQALLVPLELGDEPCVAALGALGRLLLLLVRLVDDLAQERHDHVVLARLLALGKLLGLVLVRERSLEALHLVRDELGAVGLGRRDERVHARDERRVHRDLGLELLELELALLALLVDVALLPPAGGGRPGSARRSSRSDLATRRGETHRIIDFLSTFGCTSMSESSDSCVRARVSRQLRVAAQVPWPRARRGEGTHLKVVPLVVVEARHGDKGLVLLVG